MIAVLLAALAPAQTFIVENVRVETGSGQIIESGTVVVRDGRILGVGPSGTLPPRGLPADAPRIDGTGKVLTPGFIEAQSQLGVSEISQEPTTNDFQVDNAALTPGLRVADAFNPLSVRIPISREEGVTAAITSPRGGVLYGLGYFFELTGTWSSRPDPTRPTAMFGGVGAQAARAVGGSRGNVWLALRQAFEDARTYRSRGTVSPRAPTDAQALPTQHLEALYPVIDGAIPLVLDANRAADILTALTFAREQRLRVIIAGGAEAWMVARELKQSRAPVILQPSVQLPSTFDQLQARDDVATLLEEAGVQVILSTGDGDQNVRRLRQEAGLAISLGLPRQAALRAITLAPAEAFGYGATHGSISTGKRADLTLWSGDPFEPASIAERVWIEGREMSLDNRQLQLARRYLGAPKTAAEAPAKAP